jgi:NAD(P)-dependent dehydrogenase (short-subunit alcohol dehydrogenase family)
MSRRAVVTAGAGGIGLATARRLRADGFEVTVLDIDDDAGAQASQEGLGFIRTDFGDEDAIRAAFAEVGPVHTLVNNVGVRGGTGALWDIPIDDYRRTLDINTVSHILAAQLVIPGMKERGEGCLIQIASGAARTGAIGRAPYGISKWALLGLTKSLANELAPWGIRANAVLPGIIAGERFEGSIALHAQEEGITREQALERIMGRTRLKRFIDPSEIAGAVAYLAGDDGVGITGVFLDVSGGFE